MSPIENSSPPAIPSVIPSAPVLRPIASTTSASTAVPPSQARIAGSEPWPPDPLAFASDTPSASSPAIDSHTPSCRRRRAAAR